MPRWLRDTTDWLSHIRMRDLIPILIYAVGFIVAVSLMVGQFSRTKTRKESALQQEAIRRTEERRGKESEARRKLALEGIRVVAISAPALPPSVGVGLALRSTPEDAEVFLDWKLRGRTPLRLDGIKIAGFLIIVKNGYQAWFRNINYVESRSHTITLKSIEPRPKTLLLVLSDDVSNSAFSSLRMHIANEGFTVLGANEAGEFQRAMSQAGGLSHPALRAWARTKFETDFFAAARAEQSSRDLDKQSAVLAGASRTTVRVELEMYNLRSGQHLAALSGQGSAFTLDRSQGLRTALSQAAADVAKKLRDSFADM